MALRNIRYLGDDTLRKKCKKVEVVDDKVRALLKDMAETMAHAEGLGLAAPQVGILKRIVVIDMGEGTLAKCLCHEIDHLDGILFIDKVTEMIQ